MAEPVAPPGLGYGPMSEIEVHNFASTATTQDAVIAKTALGWYVGFYSPQEARTVYRTAARSRGVTFAFIKPGQEA